MNRRPWVLVALGGLAILEAVRQGAPWVDVTWVDAYLFRAGVIYLVLGAATARFGTVALRRAAGSAIGALVVTALAGLVTRYYAEVVTEPPVGGPDPMVELILEEAAAVFLLLPIPAGYLGGVFLRQERPNPCIYLLFGSVLGGWAGAMILAPDAGGFAAAVFLVTSLAAGVAAVPPLVLMRRGHARGTTPGK